MTESLTNRVTKATEQIESAAKVYSEVKCADANTMVDTGCGQIPSVRKVLKDLGGYEYKGLWTANTNYSAKDQVKTDDQVIWLCLQDHRSGIDFQTDLNNGVWSVWQTAISSSSVSYQTVDDAISHKHDGVDQLVIIDRSDALFQRISIEESAGYPDSAKFQDSYNQSWGLVPEDIKPEYFGIVDRRFSDNLWRDCFSFASRFNLPIHTNPKNEYWIDRLEVSGKNIAILGGAKFVINNEFLLDAPSDPWVTPVSISNSYYAGTPYLPDTILPGLTGAVIEFSDANHGFNVGDVVKLASDKRYPWIALEAKRGEFAEVRFVDGNKVWLSKPIDEDFDQNTGQASNIYTKVCKIDKDLKLQIDIEVTSKELKPYPISLLYIRGFYNIDVNLMCRGADHQVLVLAGCFKGNVTANISNLRNFNEDKTIWGYGIVDKGCEQIVYNNCSFANLRHGYTTSHGGSGTTQDCYGQPRDNLIVDSIGSNGCITPFDTHACGERLTFQNCQAIGNLGAGFANRSKDTSYIDCKVVSNSEAGWQIFDGEGAFVSETHCLNTRLINCKVYGSKNFFKCAPNTGSKRTGDKNILTGSSRGCYAECQVYTQAVLLDNADWESDHDTVVYANKTGSALSAELPDEPGVTIRIQRGYFAVIDSHLNIMEFNANLGYRVFDLFMFMINSTFNGGENGREVFISCNGFTFNNGVFGGQWNSLKQIVVGLDGQLKKSNEVYDHLKGLKHTYIRFNPFRIYAKTIDQWMEPAVLGYYKSLMDDNPVKEGWYSVISESTYPKHPSYGLGQDNRFITLDSRDADDPVNPKMSVRLYNNAREQITVNCIPIGADTVIDITEIESGISGMPGQELVIYNLRTDGKVKVTAPNVAGGGSTVYTRGLVGRYIWNGFGDSSGGYWFKVG